MNTTNILNGVTLASRDEVTEHTENATVHLTEEERNTWNAKADASALAGKVDTGTFTAHETDPTVHVSQEEREKWNARTTKGVVAATQDGLDEHTENTTVHITEEERITWNAEVDSSELNSKVSTDTFNTHKNDSTVHITAQERNRWNTTAPANLATINGNNNFTGGNTHAGTETFKGSLMISGSTQKTTLESADTSLQTLRSTQAIIRMQSVYDSFFGSSSQADYHVGGCWTNASAIPQKGVLTQINGEGHKDDGSNSHWIHVECPAKCVVHFGSSNSSSIIQGGASGTPSTWDEAPWALHLSIPDVNGWGIGYAHNSCIWTLIGKNYCGNNLPVLIAYNVTVHKPVLAAILWDRTYFPLHTTWGIHDTPDHDPDYGSDIIPYRWRYSVSLALPASKEYNLLGYADVHCLGKPYMYGGGSTTAAVDGITSKAIIRTHSGHVNTEESTFEEAILCKMYNLKRVEPSNWEDSFETAYNIEPAGGTITGDVNCDGENRLDYGWGGAIISLAEWVHLSQFSVHKDNSGPRDIIVDPNETGKERWCYVLTGLSNRRASKIIKITQKAS